eukprot:sb/3471449/
MILSNKTEVPVKNNFPEPSGELVELQREVIRLQKEVIQLKEELHSAEKSAFSTTMRKELKSYSAVLSQNCAAAVAPRRLQTALKKATTPVESEMDRSKNIMVFGLPEADNEEETATREAVMKVLAHLEVYSICKSGDEDLSAASTDQGISGEKRGSPNSPEEGTVSQFSVKPAVSVQCTCLLT